MGSLMLCHCLHPYLNILSPRFGVLTRWPWSGFRTGRSFVIGCKAPSRLLHIGVITPFTQFPDSFPFPFACIVVCLRLLHCARVATTVGPASDTSSEGTNSGALDGLLDRPLLDEALDMSVELDDELLLELELELELELLSAGGTTISVVVQRQEWVIRFPCALHVAVDVPSQNILPPLLAPPRHLYSGPSS